MCKIINFNILLRNKLAYNKSTLKLNSFKLINLR